MKKSAAVVLVALVCTCLAHAQEDSPNVVFFLVDDMGWTDVGCFGSDFVQTPNIDRLAGQGVRFTNAYAPACSCSPSRAGIITGKYPAHLGMTAIIEKHRANNAPDDAPWLPATTRPFLPHEEVTIAEALKTKGYATCLIGKWHLGVGEYGPLGHGFDIAIAPPHSGMPKSYFWPRWRGNPKMEGRFEGEYLTDRLAEEACNFIDEHSDKPFFLYLPFYSVHVPIEAKADKVAKYESLLADGTGRKHTNAHYASMVESVDDAVGCVLAKLTERKLYENTMIVFFSDNGGLAHPSHVGEHTPATSNRPLRSGKGFLYEGGIREPLIVKWPGVSAPGEVCSAPVHGCDLFPTICAAAGVDARELAIVGSLDGINLEGLLKRPSAGQSDRSLYWHYPHFSSMGGRPSGAIRSGKWKLIEHFETNTTELYDLDADIGESRDLARQLPEKARELQRELAAWRSRMNALMPNLHNPKYVGKNKRSAPRNR
ncbi:MAG: sulfatase [Planctomycetota bacterium]|jgi:arylsulfatase A-like enzyme